MATIEELTHAVKNYNDDIQFWRELPAGTEFTLDSEGIINIGVHEPGHPYDGIRQQLPDYVSDAILHTLFGEILVYRHFIIETLIEQQRVIKTNLKSELRSAMIDADIKSYELTY